MDNKIIKIEGLLSKVLFPKYPVVLGTSENIFGIVSWTPMLVLEGDPVTDGYNNLVIKGDYHEEINQNKTYTIIAKEKEDEERGIQYELMFIGEIINLSSVNNQKAFLQTFLTDGQIGEMFKVLENPLHSIEKHDLVALKKVTGVGDYIANCIFERFEDNKDNCSVYLELDGYGLSPKFIQKLIKKYKNPSIVVDIVKTNPYKLSFDIDGIGFKTADEIALKSGISPYSPNRIKGYINFLLNQLGESGNSFVTSGELTSYIFDEFGGKDNILEVYTDEEGNVTGNNIGVAIEELQSKNIIRIDDSENKASRKVYLVKYYDLEKEISEHLKRIASADNNFVYDNWEEIVKSQEQKQGWKFTDEQKNGIKLGLDNQVCFITGGAGCVDCDTEFFNGKQWKKISEYIESDLVLQYHEEGYADLVKPSKYHKYPETELTLIKNQTGSINQCLSDGHNVFYKTEKGKFYKKPFHEIRKSHNESKQGFRGKFLTTFNYDGKGIELSEYEIRLMVAVIADGHYINKTNLCRVNLLKSRKKERLEWILKELNLDYDTKEYDNNGFTEYYFLTPIRTKVFTSYWYDCTKEQLALICDEVLHWDGSLRSNRMRFFTTIKETADFVQFAFASIGKRSTINIEDRIGQTYLDKPQYTRKTLEYNINITQGKPEVCLRNRHTKNEMVSYKTKDGYKYCFTVPTHLLVLRRNGRIFITGNTGKSSLVSGILQSLKSYSFAQTALSGKASARLQEVTGKEGYTIHRLLGFVPPYNFSFNEDNPLVQDIIILDEISLVGGDIFLSLIKAIPSGTKLIILGDMGQLESIGCMNLAHDIFYSEFITTIKLNKIHRQAQKSGIIVASKSIDQQIPLYNKNFVGVETVGELQDMHFDIIDSSSETRSKVISYFKQYYESNMVKDILDLQILAPVKERGDASVLNLNMDVQEYLNPAATFKKQIKVELSKNKVFYLREGDKVMCIKNNYKLFNTSDFKTPVFNGWIGILEDINTYANTAIIYFPIIKDRVIFSISDVKGSIVLGYASTIHKYQGSSAKCIIGVADNTIPPTMRTKELLYTLITRAEFDCTVVVQNSTLHSSTLNSGIKDKNTFLTDLLDNK